MDPLFLQTKEAEASVYERFAGASPYASHGERVVTGQRLLQAASDVLLGAGVGLLLAATATCGSSRTRRAPPSSR